MRDNFKFNPNRPTFREGDGVTFRTRKGEKVVARVVRVNEKTLSVEEADGKGWRVSPVFCEPCEAPKVETPDFRVGEDVNFFGRGSMRRGRIIRVNRQTLSIDDGEGRGTWRVPLNQAVKAA